MQSDIWQSLSELFLEISAIYPLNLWGLFFAINTIFSLVFIIYFIKKLDDWKATWGIPILIFIIFIIILMFASGSVQGAMAVLEEVGKGLSELASQFGFGLWGGGLGIAAVLTASFLVYLLEKLKQWNAVSFIRPLAVLGLVASCYMIVNGMHWFSAWDPSTPFVKEFLKNTVTLDDLLSLNLKSIFQLKDFFQDQLIINWPPITVVGGVLGIVYYSMCSLNPNKA